MIKDKRKLMCIIIYNLVINVINHSTLLSVHTGFEVFLFKYLVYFLRFIAPFDSRSVAASLNISSETGLVVSSSKVYFVP